MLSGRSTQPEVSPPNESTVDDLVGIDVGFTTWFRCPLNFSSRVVRVAAAGNSGVGERVQVSNSGGRGGLVRKEKSRIDEHLIHVRNVDFLEKRKFQGALKYTKDHKDVQP